MLEWLINFIPNLPSFVAGAVSGLLTVIVKYYFDQKLRKREYTTNLLLQLNAGQYLAPIAFTAFKLSEKGVGFCRDLSAAELVSVEVTLDYLEFVAVCHRQGIVDTETLIRQEGAPIVQLFRAARPWIDEYRHRVKSDAIYHELERLVAVIDSKRPGIYGELAHSVASTAAS